jgi:squalene-hopene/tetraprenyl-beta-curcumene cyclase
MTLAFTEKAQPSLRQPELQKSSIAATQALLQCQQRDGHWVFELEADATIPAEYVLLRHFRGEQIDKEL